jgi:putative AdoMet-dependent methyltransferase
MLDETGFNLWASEYDKTVAISDENNEYPFAGYNKLMNTVLKNISEIQNVNTVLDVGIGTGLLSQKLYILGKQITGIDFSQKMLSKSKIKMQNAKLLLKDITQGMPDAIENCKYDIILSTYAMHHIRNDKKAAFIDGLARYLNGNGKIIIGDIMFENEIELRKCKDKFAKIWDDDEDYIVVDSLKGNLSTEYDLQYIDISFCAGIIIMGAPQKG